MKNKKKTAIVCLLVLLLIATLFGCNDKKRTIDSPAAPEGEIVLTADNIVEMLTKYGHSHAKFKLENDIVLKNEWTPLARTLSTAFNGTIEGNNCAIIGLKYSGWESDGTPKEGKIIKRILGWKEDGVTPVYKSNEIVYMKTQQIIDMREVTELVREGESKDSSYVEMVEKGIVEEQTAFGSIGLFGYTNGATIKNLKIDGADIEFYGEGEYVYAGLISGYDIGSTFNSITVQNSKILASTISQNGSVNYSMTTGRPASAVAVQKSNTKQFIGSLVGYSRGNTTVKDNVSTYKTTDFVDVKVNNVILDNHNYSAFFNAKLKVKKTDERDTETDTNILVTELKEEEGYGFYYVEREESLLENSTPTEQSFIGGVSGYSDGAKMKDITVDGINYDRDAWESNAVTQDMHAARMNAGGISSTLLNTNSTVDNVTVKNAIFYISKDVPNSYSAQIGGAFGELKSAKVIGKCQVSDMIVDVRDPNIKSVCEGGVIGYCDEGAIVQKLSAENVFLQSNFKASGELGSILGGIIGVLRDATVSDSTAKDIEFNVVGNAMEDGVNADYCFTRVAIAQVYGNSTIGEGISASDCTFVCKEKDWMTEKTTVTPVVARNTYVNEDGYYATRLYYYRDGELSPVYVTVYGELVPKMAQTGYRLFDDTVWTVLTAEEKKVITDHLEEEKNNICNISKKYCGIDDYYYYYFAEVDKEKGTVKHHWNVIRRDTLSETYQPDWIYAKAVKVYLVELPDSKIGTAIPTDGVAYYTYDITKGALTKATGNFVKDTDYYVKQEDITIGEYELDVTVYTESDSVVAAVGGNAKAVYVIDLTEYAADSKVTDGYGNTFDLCPAETYFNKFFKEGEGFLKDKNDFVIKDASGKANRDFSKYRLLSGRPSVKNSVEYTESGN